MVNIMVMSYVCVCVVCLPVGANLWTGTSRCLTEGTSSLSGTFVTKVFSLKLFRRKLEAL